MPTRPDCKINIINHQWIKQMEFKGKGCLMEGHAHTFDHPTLLAVGRFKVTVEGVENEYPGGTILYIEKGKIHSIESLDDYGLGYCLHIIRDGENVEDIVDPDSVPLFNGTLVGMTPLTKR